MSRQIASILAIAILTAVTLGISTHQGAAQPFSGAAWHDALRNELVHEVHGFHCRSVLGWDPRAGVYSHHRHEGICRDYKRCMRVMYRCNLRTGRGWDSWSYERWGWDNWRFSSCMLEAGCY